MGVLMRLVAACLLIHAVFLESVNACTVDNGKFLKIITVREELDVGTTVGSLELDDPSSVKSISTDESSPFFQYYYNNDTFVVTDRIDVDQGLNTDQTMILECITTNGLPLEIEIEFEIEDINDFSPEFKPTDNYNFSVSEVAIKNTQIGILQAVDKDRENSYVSYELLPSVDSENFELKSITGGKARLTVVKPLDYEQKTLYSLSVLAKDCQNPINCLNEQRTSSAQITINVEDADDLSPEFGKLDYRATIFDDSVEGAVVVQTVAKDQDTLNEPIKYTLSGNGSQYFSIDPNTGMVTVTRTEGIVRGRQYLLQVKAWQVNDDTKRATASLVIKIVATNGNAPQFTEDSYHASLSEGSPVNTTAVIFRVTDRDTDLTSDFFGSSQVSQMNFTLIKSPQRSLFALRVTGWNSAELYLISSLDYELTKSYNFIIQVSDGEYIDNADVFIEVLNENDHNPTFEQQNYKFEVTWEKDAAIGTVKAFDKDMSPEEKVVYKILPPHDKLFEIDSNGRVTLASDLIHYKDSVYLINIQATDGGRSPRTSTITVEITINNIPVISTSGQLTGSDDEVTEPKDRLVLYVISGIAGFLLVLVTIFILCFLKRRANKTSENSQKKDAEQKLEMAYTKPFGTDSLKSSTVSQGSYSKDTLTTVDDHTAQTPFQPMSRQDDLELQANRKLETFGYRELSEVSSDDNILNHCHSIQQYSNNLSAPDQLSQTEQEFAELSQHSLHSDDNNVPRSVPDMLTIKCNSDSGRSSLREEKSPFMQRVPFKSFQHAKSASGDDTELSQDEEISYMTRNHRPNRVLQSNSFNLALHRPDIRNVRATEGPPIRTESFNIGMITEVPEGFRSCDSVRTNRTVSPVSSTSDYSSNTPTHELNYQNMTSYSNLPAQSRDNKSSFSSRNSFHLDRREKIDVATPYHTQNTKANNEAGRCSTPDSDVSQETESTVNDEANYRPQMTIYF